MFACLDDGQRRKLKTCLVRKMKHISAVVRLVIIAEKV